MFDKVKRFAFNGLFYGYSIILIAYMVGLKSMTAVPTEWWEQQMTIVAAITLAVVILSGLLMEVLDRKRSVSLGRILFSARQGQQAHPGFGSRFGDSSFLHIDCHVNC